MNPKGHINHGWIWIRRGILRQQTAALHGVPIKYSAENRNAVERVATPYSLIPQSGIW
jgi:hypothetical protein